MDGKSMVTFGGGVSDLIAANELHHKLPYQHRVILVEKNAQHAFAPHLLWLIKERAKINITKEEINYGEFS